MKHYMIGEILESGEIVKGETVQGMVYKNSKAFYKKLNEVCYVPELDEDNSGFTYEDFLNLTGGNEKIATQLFESVDWQSPGTLLDEWFAEGEVYECNNCNHMFFSYGVDCCPNCNHRKIDNIVETDDKVEYLYTVDDSEFCVTMFPELMEDMDWSWESLIYAHNEETFAIVEDKATGQKTVLNTNGEVEIVRLDTNTKLSIDEIIALAKEGFIDETIYQINYNNWFSLEYYDKENMLEDDVVFEATPKNCMELATLLMESHLSHFEE